MSILLSMHSFHHWGYSIQKGDFLYNSIIVVQERTFDVTVFFKDDFSLIWIIWAAEKWVNILVGWLLLQNGSRESWKLCVNLCLLKWLSPTQTYKYFNSTRIVNIKCTTRTWSDAFKDLFFKSTNRFQILNIVDFILHNSRWIKKEFWKY